MKKSIFTAVLAVILTLTLVSCSNKKEKDETLPEGFVRLENMGGEYTFAYPKSWIIDRNDGMVQLHVSEKDASGISVTAFAPPREGMTTLEEYLKSDYLDHLKSTLPTLEVSPDAFEETTLGTKDARKIVFDATVSDKDYRFMQVITLNNDGYIYIFTYTSTPDVFKTHEDNVNKVLDTFSFN